LYLLTLLDRDLKQKLKMAFLTQLFRFVKLELSIGNDFYHSDCDTSMADQRNHSLKMNCVANGKHHRPCSMLVTLALLFLVILFGFGNEMLLYRYYCTSENYFMHLWLESIFGSICIYLVMMNLQYPLDQCNFRDLKTRIVSIWQVLIFFLGITIARGYNFDKWTANAGGTEFIQMSSVMGIPAAITGAYIFKRMQVSWQLATSLTILSALKLTWLLNDPEFAIASHTFLGSLFLAISYSGLLIFLSIGLERMSILVLLYCMTVFLSLTLPFVSILFGEFNKLHVENVTAQTLMMALAKDAILMLLRVGSIVFLLMLLKISDPITCAVSENFNWMLLTLYKALVMVNREKKDLTVSSLKTFFVIFGELVFIFFYRRLNRIKRTDDQEIDSTTSNRRAPIEELNA